jgi:hypothetical protein
MISLVLTTINRSLHFKNNFYKISNDKSYRKQNNIFQGDPWSGFLYRVQEAPHMTDGFSEFYCLYLHASYYSKALNTTVLEVIDYMVDKTYFIHLGNKYSFINYNFFEDEKKANKYEYDWNDDDDDFILISLDGIYKQIYIGRDMPIEYGKSRLSVQPIISEVVEDFQYYLE